MSFWQGETDADRIELGDAGQRGRIRLYQAARVDADSPDAAGNRRTQGIETETDARALECRLVGAHRCLLCFQLGLHAIGGALRDEAFLPQFLAARQLPLEIGQRCLVLGKLRFGLQQIDLVGAVVEGKQHLAGLDELAFLDMHPGDHVADLRTNVHAV